MNVFSKNRFASPLVRVSMVAFFGVSLAALGCSLLIDFDESKIPAAETGVEGDSIADTGTPPGDTSPKPDSDATATDSHPSDTPTDTTDTTPPPDTADTAPTDTADTAPTDTGTDTGVPDTGADTTVPDTAADTTVPDTDIDTGVDAPFDTDDGAADTG